MQTITIGLLGVGTVGAGVARLLERQPHIRVVKAAVRDLTKSRGVAGLTADKLTTDPMAVVNDPDIQVVVELMGGLDLPYQVIKSALGQGKHVVTANKVVIATHGPELFALAKQNNVNLLFEAAVAGGIPIINPLKTSLAANQIEMVAGILNGTTNYILTRMAEAGLDFAEALKEAQDKGFAEADPTADVEGHDAACKIAILSAIAYNATVDYNAVHCEGISTIGAQDIDMAKTLGYAIRLIALGKHDSGSQGVDVRVHPMLVPLVHPLASIAYENNAIWVKGDAVGEVMFYGKGAGQGPTASSVMGDLLLLAEGMQLGQKRLPGYDFMNQQQAQLVNILKTRSAYYIRLETDDEAGVIGQLGTACGRHNVSLDAIMQRGLHPGEKSATIVLLTHQVSEADMQAALAEIKSFSTTRKVHSVLRVLD